MNTPLSDILGSQAAASVLLYLYHYNEGYGRGIAGDLDLSLIAVQKQLEKYEKNRILVSQHVGRTILYKWNEKSRLSKRLKDLVAIVYDGFSLEERAGIFKVRRRPRSKDKPVL